MKTNLQKHNFVSFFIFVLIELLSPSRAAATLPVSVWAVLQRSTKESFHNSPHGENVTWTKMKQD